MSTFNLGFTATDIAAKLGKMDDAQLAIRNAKATGGGTIITDASLGISWSSPIRVFTNYRSALCPEGWWLIDANLDPCTSTFQDGTVQTVAAGGKFALGTDCALYYALPVGAVAAAQAGLFHTTNRVNTTTPIPYNWFLIAQRDNNSNRIWLWDGRHMGPSATLSL